MNVGRRSRLTEASQHPPDYDDGPRDQEPSHEEEQIVQAPMGIRFESHSVLGRPQPRYVQTWSDDRTRVKPEGAGARIVIWGDARHVRVTSDIPTLGGRGGACLGPDGHGCERGEDYEAWSEGKGGIKGDRRPQPLRALFVPLAPRDLDEPPQAAHTLSTSGARNRADLSGGVCPVRPRLRAIRLVEITVRIAVELLLALQRAEIEGLATELRLRHGRRGVYFHFADRVESHEVLLAARTTTAEILTQATCRRREALMTHFGRGTGAGFSVLREILQIEDQTTPRRLS
jgi:hypothetical protein